MAAYSTCGWQRESDIYGKLIELERRLNHYKSSGFNPIPAAQETLSGIEKNLCETKDLISDRFWINIANQKNGVVQQEEAPQKSDIASQKNGVFRQEETPPKFDSQNEHWHNFVRLFETVAELNEWSDSVKAGKLILSMQGTAQKFALAQPFSIRGDFGNLKNLLEQYFDPVERRETAFYEFQSRTHRSDESLQDYFQEMMDLAYRAFPDIPDVTLSGQVINRFIQGLQTRECRKHVRFSKPKTLYDVLKYAVSYKIFDTFDKDPKLPMVENHQRTPKAPVPIHVHSSTLKSENESRQKISTDSTHRKTSTISGLCWNCSEPGHRAVECPKPCRKGRYGYQPSYVKRGIPWNPFTLPHKPIFFHLIPCYYYQLNSQFRDHPRPNVNFMRCQGKSPPRFPGAAHAG